MTTLSGTASFALTAAQVITYALGKIGVLRANTPANANEAAGALIELDCMMKEWGLTGPYLSTRREAAITLAANTASYDLASLTNPLRVMHARYRNSSGIDLPMEWLDHDAYFSLPQKTSSGPPTQYFFDPQSAHQTFYIWPVPPSVTTETIQYTYQRRINDIGLITDNIDVPQEWLSTVGYGLATRLCDDYGISDAVSERIHTRASQLRQLAMDFDREPVVQFMPEARYGRG